MKNRIPSISLIGIITLLPVLAACSSEKTRSATYEFTNIRRGNVERTVSSSGTINPVSTVNVLPRMSGKVEKIYVDYNDTVRTGDILAELNTELLRLKWDSQYASVAKTRANYELQLINYNNQLVLAEKNLISEYDLKSSKNLVDSQAADLAIAEANLKEIETQINQYAYVTSPIDGIILDKNITAGDTVVDSSGNNASRMFIIAENLREMQIEALVGELDVASIYKGQTVRFTLESLPGRNFIGEVDNVRMVPVVSSGVVSYTVMIKAENEDGSLLPGMTCAVDFVVERVTNVLTVSNAALRYQPTSLSAEQIADMVFEAGLAGLSEEEKQAARKAREEAAAAQTAAQNSRQQQNTGIAGILGGGNIRIGGFGGGQQSGQGTRASVVMRNLWFIGDDGKLGVMRVQTGISNGTSTEIITTDELEGIQVIMRERL